MNELPYPDWSSDAEDSEVTWPWILTSVFLAVCYLLLCTASGAALVRLSKKSALAAKNGPSHFNFSWQVAFYWLLAIGSLIKAFTWLATYHIGMQCLRIPQTLAFFLNSLPTFLFCATYFILLLFWVEIYHGTRLDVSFAVTALTKFKAFFFVVVILVSSTSIALYIVDWLRVDQEPANPLSQVYTWAQKGILIMGSTIYFFLMIGYAVYGCLLYQRLVRLKAASGSRCKLQKKVCKILRVCTQSHTGMLHKQLIRWIVCIHTHTVLDQCAKKLAH
eukprot:Colp12_sorted_trinity150504_noHs@21982